MTPNDFFSGAKHNEDMPSAGRLVVCLALGIAGLSVGCSNDVSIEAPDVARSTVEPTRAPASTNNVSAEDVDTTVDVGAVEDPMVTAVPERSNTQQSTPEHDQIYASIRDVDFMNGFSYHTGFDLESSMSTVTDGSFENGQIGDVGYYWFGVTDVDFGDLNNDGADEAIVTTSWNGGGSGYFDSVRAFRLVDGEVQAAGTVLFGDRADGGVFDARIEDGTAYVWSFSTTLGACCPSEIRRNTLVLGEYWLAQADATPTQAWISLDSYRTDRELKFLPGTSSAMVVMYEWENQGAFTFDAAQGQRLTLAHTGGPAAATISVTSLVTGQVFSGLADVVLPADGLYEVTIAFDAERDTNTTFDVIIDDGDLAPPISWLPAVEQRVVTEEPYVTTSLVWPVFSSDKPGTAAANDALASFVLGLDDSWIEDVTEFSTPLDDSSYDIQYEVTVATAEIVAVRFDFYDYVCCRPYPNYGPISAVLDLQAGRLLPVNEIVDMNRIDEINRLWITELDKQQLLADTVDALLTDVFVSGQPGFDSLTLLPHGVEFGTMRNGLGGGSPGTLTVVGYDQLGSLVNPDLLIRLRAP